MGQAIINQGSYGNYYVNNLVLGGTIDFSALEIGYGSMVSVGIPCAVVQDGKDTYFTMPSFAKSGLIKFHPHGTTNIGDLTISMGVPAQKIEKDSDALVLIKDDGLTNDTKPNAVGICTEVMGYSPLNDSGEIERIDLSTIKEIPLKEHMAFPAVMQGGHLYSMIYIPTGWYLDQNEDYRITGLDTFGYVLKFQYSMDGSALTITNREVGGDTIHLKQQGYGLLLNVDLGLNTRFGSGFQAGILYVHKVMDTDEEMKITWTDPFGDFDFPPFDDL